MTLDHTPLAVEHDGSSLDDLPPVGAVAVFTRREVTTLRLALASAWLSHREAGHPDTELLADAWHIFHAQVDEAAS